MTKEKIISSVSKMGGGKLKAVFAAFVLLFGLTLSSCESCSGDKGKGKVDAPNVTDATGRNTPNHNPNVIDAVDGDTPNQNPNPNVTDDVDRDTPNPNPAPTQTPKQIAEADVRVAIKKVVDAIKNVNDKAQVAGTKEKDIAKVMKPKLGDGCTGGVDRGVDKWIDLLKQWTATRTLLHEKADDVIASCSDVGSWNLALVVADSPKNKSDEARIDNGWGAAENDVWSSAMISNNAWRGCRDGLAASYPSEFANAAVADFYTAKIELGNAVNELKDGMTKWIDA
jgi:hypothetical protein